MLEERSDVCGRERRLVESDMLNARRISGFLADVRGDNSRRRESSCDSNGGREPSGLGQQIMIGHRVGDTVGAGPGPCWCLSGKIADFAALAGREGEVHAASSRGEGLEDGGAGVVVRASYAARSARKSDIGKRLSASECAEGSLEELQRLRAGSGGLLSRNRNGKYEGNRDKKEKPSHSHGDLRVAVHGPVLATTG